MYLLVINIMYLLVINIMYLLVINIMYLLVINIMFLLVINIMYLLVINISLLYTYSRLNIMKFFFANRIVKLWNKLYIPEKLVLTNVIQTSNDHLSHVHMSLSFSRIIFNFAFISLFSTW